MNVYLTDFSCITAIIVEDLAGSVSQYYGVEKLGAIQLQYLAHPDCRAELIANALGRVREYKRTRVAKGLMETH